MNSDHWFRGFVAGMQEAQGGSPSFPRYQSLEKLGEGGQAEVYRAWDGELKRRVALKVLHESPRVSEDVRRRFEREARLMAGLSHPNVVSVYDVVTSGERLCLVMELIEGPPLDRVLAGRKLGMRELVGILHQACLGVAAAHEKGIVHRDLKPGNILLTSDGKAKVGDFGLAHVADGATKLTATGAPMGTPLYMAPEQVEGASGAISARTDVYALGAILYEMATGQPPHAARTVGELYARILGAEPATPRSRNPKVPRDLETVIVKALEKEPPRRYADARELADDLGRWLEGEAIQARPATWGYRARKFVRRRKAVVGVAAAGIALAAGLAAYLIPKWRGERKVKVALELERIEREKKREARDRAQPYLKAGERGLEELRLRLKDWEATPDEVYALFHHAMGEFNRALKEDPEYPEAYVGISRAYWYVSDIPKALEAVDRAIRVSPGFATAYLDRVRLLFEKYLPTTVDSNLDLAEPTPESRDLEARIVADLQMVDRHSRDLAERTYASGLLASAQGDHERAQLILAEYLKAVPGDSGAHCHRGRALYRLKRLEEAEAELSLAIQCMVRNASAIQMRAIVRAERKDFGGALADCEHLLSSNPRHCDALTIRGKVHSDRGETDLALEDYTRAIEADDRSEVAYCNRGRSRFRKADIAGAWEDLNRTLALNPRYLPAYQLRSDLRIEKREFREALEDCARMLAINPRYSLAHYQRGRVHFHMGDFDAAVGGFTQALDIDPRDALAWLGRGKSHFEKRDPDSAIPDLSRAIELQGDSADAYYYLARAHGARNESAQSIREFDRAIELDSKHMGAYWGRAVMRASVGDSPGAISDYTQAIRLAPRQAELYYHRGWTLAYLRTFGWALADYMTAWALAPPRGELRRQIAEALRQMVGSS